MWLGIISLFLVLCENIEYFQRKGSYNSSPDNGVFRYKRRVLETNWLTYFHETVCTETGTYK